MAYRSTPKLLQLIDKLRAVDNYNGAMVGEPKQEHLDTYRAARDHYEIVPPDTDGEWYNLAAVQREVRAAFALRHQ